MTTIQINDGKIYDNIYRYSLNDERNSRTFRHDCGGVFLASPPSINIIISFIVNIPEEFRKYFILGKTIEKLNVIDEFIGSVDFRFDAKIKNIFKTVIITGYEEVLRMNEQIEYRVSMEALSHVFEIPPEVQKMMDLNDLIHKGEIFVGFKK